MNDVPDPLVGQLSTLRKDLMRLMQVLIREGATYENSAGEITRVADTFEQNGSFGEAEAMRVLARTYRIRALEMQGQIAALWHKHAGLCEKLGSGFTPSARVR